MSDAQWVEPSEEDVAAIAAVVFAERLEPERDEKVESPWLRTGRIENIERWEQPGRLSRLSVEKKSE